MRSGSGFLDEILLRNRSRPLLDLDDDELRGLESRGAHEDIDDAQVDVALTGRLLVALDETDLQRGTTGERALTREEVLHERPEVRPDPGLPSGSSFGSKATPW